MGARALTLFADGIHHAEAMRWRDGRLWFSDVFSDESVISIGLDGHRTVEARVDGRTESIGWLPNGDLLIVAMDRREVLRRNSSGGIEIYADLNGIAGGPCNGMVIHPTGNAYVCNFGFDVEEELVRRGREAVMADYPTSTMACIRPDGKVESAVSGLRMTGNAPVITPEGKTIIFGEMYGHCLTAMDIAEDGSLSNRRLWAALPGMRPDGICLDAEGAIWAGLTMDKAFVRVAEGGEILERIDVEDGAWSCMLGGEDGRTLFLSITPSANPEDAYRDVLGRILTTRVEAPHAGYP